MESRKSSSDAEDIPSDFFDDFSKDEFIKGLSVIDSWNGEEKMPRTSRPRIDTAALDNVRDLRELINRDEEDNKYKKRRYRMSPNRKVSSERRLPGSTNLDDYIKPGSRRDPNKTNEAIKRDKEEKVKEHLAKQLESVDDLRPPGTELDDFFDGKKNKVVKDTSETKMGSISPPFVERRLTPIKRRDSPVRRREFSPKIRHPHYIPRRTQFSPHRGHYNLNRAHYSPHRSPRRSPRRSFRNFSPTRSNRRWPRGSPHRSSPDFRRRYSRSPVKNSYRRSRSRSRSPRLERSKQHMFKLSQSPKIKLEKDDFLYPKNFYQPGEFSAPKDVSPYQPPQPVPQYTEPMIVAYPGGVSGFLGYSQSSEYSGFPAPYEYGVQPNPPMLVQAPQPVPAPVPVPIIPAPTDVHLNPVAVPEAVHMISPQVPSSFSSQLPNTNQKPQEDALAKLVTDGKLSHADYLKLAPNKGATHVMDTHTKMSVLKRCEAALCRLGMSVLPNQLVINNALLNSASELKQIAPKFCSPLKRQTTMELHFTNNDASAISRTNKQIVENILKSLQMEEFLEKPKRTVSKNMKDAAVQTTKPFCDVCAIRDSTKYVEAGTSIDRDYISSTVHTQVLDQDLVSSKALFNPSGNVTDGAPISIAHMTPAQLVSQLAARAKTLKQPDQSQSSSQYRTQPNYDYDGRGNRNSYYRF